MSKDNVTLFPFDISERNPGLVKPTTKGGKPSRCFAWQRSRCCP